MRESNNIKWLIAVSVGIMIMLVNFDTTIVNLAIPAINHQFHTNVSQTQWVISLYLLAAVVSFMVGGHLADFYGKKKIFLMGAFLFTVSSFVIAISNQLSMLLIMRFIQGIGFAFTLALAITIITAYFPKHQQGLAVGISITISGVSQAVGPSLGGIILTVSHWPMLFWINVPLGLLSIVMTACLYKDLERTELSKGVSFFRGFIDLNVFKLIKFNMTWSIRMLFMVVWAGIMFFMPIYLQTHLEISPLNTGLIILCMTGMIGVASPITGKLIDRFGADRLIFLSLIVAMLSMLVFVILNSASGILWIALALALFGISVGFLLPSSIYAAMKSLPKTILGKGMGVYFTLTFIGSSLGVSSASFFHSHLATQQDGLIALMSVNFVLLALLLIPARKNIVSTFDL